MDFEKICTIFSMQEPYYGILLSAMDRFPTKQIPTLGICRSGNVFRLGYNPDFIADKDLDAMMALLKHETLHVAFSHFDGSILWGDHNPSKEEHMIRNFASDLEVNGYIDFSRTKDIHPMLAKDFGWEEHLGTKEYFSRLLQMNQQQKQQEQAQNPQKPCNGGKGGQQQQQNQGKGQNNDNQEPDDGDEGEESENQQNQEGGLSNQRTNQGKENQSQNQAQDEDCLSKQLQEALEQSIDDHSMWPDDMTEDQLENLKQSIDDLLVFAAEEVEKGRGTVPAEMQGKIQIIRDKRKPRPVADWKKYFRRYIGNEFTDQLRKSRKRESQRFPDAAGNRHRRKSHILVAIDTSGSVSMPEYREFFGQLKTLMKATSFHVVECDARIQHEYDFNGVIQETLHGGGGTDFEPPIELYLKNRRKYEGIVYFTDGYAPIPSNTPKEMLWVVSSNGDHDRKKYQVNGASVVFIPKQDNYT